MPIHTFQGFFSYAHLDAAASPRLIDGLTVDLEMLVSAKLLNATLSVWRDKTNLRTGERWDPTIEGVLRRSDILIALFTPSWIQSEYCRKEYLIFEEVEATYGGGAYVVPILARPLGEQERHLTPEQRLVNDSLHERQYFPMLAPDFLILDEDARKGKLEEIADDDNRLSHIANASNEVEASKIKSELRVALDTKGVHLVEAPAAKMKQAKRSQIKAVILEAARRRYQVTEGGEIRRALEVHERDK
jgi:hypothetical protein